MPYEKLPIGGAQQEILSWANHAFSTEEQSMLQRFAPTVFVQARGPHAGRAFREG